MDGSVRIGDIYLMEFDGVGSEQRGIRPGVVFQNNRGNDHSPNIIALPMTSRIKKMGMPTHVSISGKKYGLPKDSVVLCENPQRMAKSKLIKYLAHLDDDTMSELATASLLAMSAIAFIPRQQLYDIWEKAKQLNGQDGF